MDESDKMMRDWSDLELEYVGPDGTYWEGVSGKALDPGGVKKAKKK